MRDFTETESATSATAAPPITLHRRRRARLARRASVEEIQGAIGRAVLARQRLRQRGAASNELERNRLDLVCLQWELSHALIERHGRGEAAPVLAAAG
jgi:hypothetical protein